MIRDTFEGLLVGIVLTAITYAIGLHYGWTTGVGAFLPDANNPTLSSWVEILGVLTNYSCVYLTIRQKMACWPIGIIAVVFLGILFFEIKLFASMTLQLGYFLPVQFAGWYNWKFGGENKTELKVSAMDWKDYAVIAAVGAVSWYVIARINIYFDASSAHLDVGILVLSVVAQLLLNSKKPESWLFWIAVNCLSIYVYYTTGAFLVAAQYLLFLGNAFAGAYLWFAENKELSKPVHYGR
jgi:nicotinamide mononucleotide transporter